MGHQWVISGRRPFAEPQSLDVRSNGSDEELLANSIPGRNGRQDTARRKMNLEKLTP
jgi:hypothetical protein